MVKPLKQNIYEFDPGVANRFDVLANEACNDAPHNHSKLDVAVKVKQIKTILVQD